MKYLAALLIATLVTPSLFASSVSTVSTVDDLRLDALPARVSDLERAELQDDREIRILKDQMKLYSDYLASKGESLEIRFQRHLNSTPESVFILGAGSGILTSGVSLVGVVARDASVVAKRFFWAGAFVTVIAAVSSHFLQSRYADSADDVAREKMVEELDANPDQEIRQSIGFLMTRQLVDLEDRNKAINAAIERTENAAHFRHQIFHKQQLKGGIIPQ